MVAILLLSGSVALGIVVTMRPKIRNWPRWMTEGLHRNISLLATCFLGMHILTTVIDPVSPVHLVNALVPFSGSYRPLAIGLGVVAVDLLAAVVITSLLRNHISHRVWKAVHWSAYACWPFALLHGLTAGTDASAMWSEVVYVACMAAVGAAVIWRLSVEPSRRVVVQRPARSQ